MITDINKFNDQDCKFRSDNIAKTYNFDDFRAKMQQQLKQQQTNTNKAQSNMVITLGSNSKAMASSVDRPTNTNLSGNHFDFEKRKSSTSTHEVFNMFN